MADVIRLGDHRANRRRNWRSLGVQFFFDLACPYTYFAAERVERSFNQVKWTPVSNAALWPGVRPNVEAEVAQLRDAVTQRARQLRLPFVWPEVFPTSAHGAARVAILAEEEGRCAEFALAASRLAFCGGYDLNDEDVIIEAGAAAGLEPARCAKAFLDEGHDSQLESNGARTLTTGADRVPILSIGDSSFCGEDRLEDARSLARLLSDPGFGLQ